MSTTEIIDSIRESTSIIVEAEKKLLWEELKRAIKNPDERTFEEAYKLVKGTRYVL